MTAPIRDDHDEIFAQLREDARRGVVTPVPAPMDATRTRGARGVFRPTAGQTARDVGRQTARGLAEAGIETVHLPTTTVDLISGLPEPVRRTLGSVGILATLLDRSGLLEAARANRAENREVVRQVYSDPTTSSGREARLVGQLVGEGALTGTTALRVLNRVARRPRVRPPEAPGLALHDAEGRPIPGTEITPEQAATAGEPKPFIERRRRTYPEQEPVFNPLYERRRLAPTSPPRLSDNLVDELEDELLANLGKTRTAVPTVSPQNLPPSQRNFLDDLVGPPANPEVESLLRDVRGALADEFNDLPSADVLAQELTEGRSAVLPSTFDNLQRLRNIEPDDGLGLEFGPERPKPPAPRSPPSPQPGSIESLSPVDRLLEEDRLIWEARFPRGSSPGGRVPRYQDPLPPFRLTGRPSTRSDLTMFDIRADVQEFSRAERLRKAWEDINRKKGKGK